MRRCVTEAKADTTTDGEVELLAAAPELRRARELPAAGGLWDLGGELSAEVKVEGVSRLDESIVGLLIVLAALLPLLAMLHRMLP